MSERKKTKKEMLDFICGAEEDPTLDEIEMTLYYLQGITNDLMRLVSKLRAEKDEA
jgi:hypothetical protein